MPDWDGFEAAAGRLADDMDFRTVRVENWQEGVFNPDTGKVEDGEYAVDVETEAEVREPTMPRTAVGPEGGESEVDAEIYVEKSDVGEIVPTGETQRASVIEDTLDGTRYRVDEVFDENNGLLRLSGVEL